MNDRHSQDIPVLSREGHTQLERAMAECSVLYNAVLQEWRDFWQWKQLGNEDTDQSITLYVQMKEFVLVCHEDSYWGSVSQQVGPGVLLRLDRARKALFNRVKAGDGPGYPRFKSRHRWHTIALAEVTRSMVRDGKVKVKGLPTMHLKQDGLPDTSQLKALRITKRGRRVTVSLTYPEEATPLPVTSASVGIDMGITDRLTLSNGESLDRRIVERECIAEKQRCLARCTNGSRECGSVRLSWRMLRDGKESGTGTLATGLPAG